MASANALAVTWGNVVKILLVKFVQPEHYSNVAPKDFKIRVPQYAMETVTETFEMQPFVRFVISLHVVMMEHPLSKIAPRP